jgi:S-adenosylmethionine decarboxylase
MRSAYLNKKVYGKELIIDLHDCDPSTFNRKSIKEYFDKLCKKIKMKQEKLVWWDDYRVPIEERQTKPHLKGTSAVQFIKTSNITIHTLDILKKAYINIFSCKNFNEDVARYFTEDWFRGKVEKWNVLERV